MSTISNSISNGITVTGSYASPLTITSTGTVDNNGVGNAITGTTNGESITNQGHVTASGSGNVAVNLSGTGNTVVNSGTITNTDSLQGSEGIFLRSSADDGSIYNSGLISGGYITVRAFGPATLTNTGTIRNASTRPAGFDYRASVFFNNGGTVTNNTGGMISGYYMGLLQGSGDLTIINSGTIEGTAPNINSYGIYNLGGPLTVDNSGLVSGSRWGIGSNLTDRNTITNTGTITGQIGLFLHGGTVANDGGMISGVAGIYFSGAGSVTNAGIIAGGTGTAAGGISFHTGGYLSNASTGTVSSGAAGVTVSGAAGTISNLGTISGDTGLVFGDFANTVTNAGKIAGTGGTAIGFGAGDDLLRFDPSTSVQIQGTVDGGAGTNTLEFAAAATYGTLTGTGANFVGFGNGTIDSGAYWVFAGSNTIGTGTTLTNSGTLQVAGSLVNDGTINVGTYNGLVVSAGTVTNTGAINDTSGFGNGIYLSGGGSVDNTGADALIYGFENGVYVYGGAGTISNSGTIIGSNGAGVYFNNFDANTLTNAGTISGSGYTAVQFGCGDDRLIVDPGAVFYGYVYGGGGNNTLELAAGATAGTLTGFYSNFVYLVVDPGSTWTLTGYGYLGSSATLTDYGTLTNDGSLTGSSLTGYGTLIVDPGTLINNGYIGISVTLAGAGNYLYNAPGATIRGSGDVAVYGYGTDGVIGVVNAGTIVGSYVGVGFCADGSVTNTGTDAFIFGGTYGVSISGDGTVTNYGTIAGLLGIYGAGVYLDSGTVTNLGTDALISGYGYGVSISGTGTVTNYGTIEGRQDIYCAGVYFDSETFTDSGTLISEPGYGVFISGDGTVTNYGTIEDLQGIYGAGVYLGSGTVTNLGTDALISGYGYGVYILNAGTVVNSGSIYALDGCGISIDGGSVNNSGSITGDYAGIVSSYGGTFDNGGYIQSLGIGIGVAGAAGTVSNLGTIYGGSVGVFLISGGSVYNDGYIRAQGAGIAVVGTYVVGGRYGTYVTNGTIGTVNNLGTVYGGFVGVYLAQGGTVDNGGTIRSSDAGVVITGTAGTVSNLGSIYGYELGVYLGRGGSVYNDGYISSDGYGVGIRGGRGTVTNDSTITGTVVGVYLRNGGTLINEGTAYVGGGHYGVRFQTGAGTVTNEGSIYGAVGIELAQGGTVANNGTASLIVGDQVGIEASHSAAAIGNAGIIRGTSDAGVRLEAGGSVGNDGLVSGGVYGVYVVGAAGSVRNTGTITGASGAGVLFTGAYGNTLNNLGTITGSVGITVTGTATVGQTITDSGVISGSGGTAIGFGYGDDRLVLVPSSSLLLDGTVDGGAGTNTLEIAPGTGRVTITNIGDTFTNFSQGTIDSGAYLVFAGGNTLVSGFTTTNSGTLAVTGTLVIAGTLTNLGSIVNDGALIIAGSSATPALLIDDGVIDGSVAFAAGNGNFGTLRITDTASLPGTIVGFTGLHDVVDLTQLSDAGNDAYALLDPATNVLTVTGDNGSVQLQLDAEDYTSVGWTVSADGAGGSDVAVGLGPPPDVTERLVADTGASSSDGVTTNPAVTGGGGSYATVIITEGTVTLGTVSADTVGVWSFMPTGLADGVHTLTARETTGGGTGTASLSFTLDTTVPVVAITSSGGLTNQATQTITGTVSDANLAASPTITLFDNGTLVGTTTASGGAWSTSVVLPGEGANDITAQASDLAGNTGTSSTDGLVLDTILPVVSITSSGGLTNQATQTITGTVSDANLPAHPTITLFDNGTSIGTTTASGGAWSASIALSKDGTHNITAQAGDLAGNTGTSSIDGLVLDTILPVVAITSSSGLTNQATQTITGTVSDANLAASPTITLFDNGTSIGTTTASGGAWSASVVLPGEGANDITAQATDLAGNTGTSNSLQLTLNTASPVVTEALLADTGVSATDGITANPAVTGAADPNATVTIDEGGITLGQATADSAGVWVFAPTGLADGAHTLTASETNAFGVTGSAALSFTLKTAAPAPSGLSLSPPAIDDTTTDLAPVVAGFGEPGDTLTVYDQTGWQGTTTVGADGSWSLATPQRAHGAYSFYATETDVAGNTSDPSATLVATIVAPNFKQLGDFDGDGSADLLFQGQDGTLMADNIVNDEVTTAAVVGQVGTEWLLQGVRDFDDDGTSDLLYRRGDGSLQIDKVVDNRVPVVDMIGQVGNEWSLIGLGDFNGDGTPDLLWQRSDDHMLMINDVQNNVVTSTNFVGAIGPEWQLMATGDFDANFDADNTADLLWQRTTDHMLMIYDMRNNQVVATPQIGQVGPEWQLIGADDFSGPHAIGILFERGDGALMVDDIVNNQVTSSTIVGQLPVGWQLLGLGDTDGDGITDLVLRNDAGFLAVSHIVNHQLTSPTSLGQVGTEWNFFS
ncbi:MAG TPA: Ig-like domain-containing protein [Stellaceae bacterium]|nr:Ig-like domain-containing protein [Stellaceae bacterium]